MVAASAQSILGVLVSGVNADPVTPVPAASACGMMLVQARVQLRVNRFPQTVPP